VKTNKQAEILAMVSKTPPNTRVHLTLRRAASRHR
jgi:hypothetical protein